MACEKSVSGLMSRRRMLEAVADRLETLARELIRWSGGRACRDATAAVVSPVTRVLAARGPNGL